MKVLRELLSSDPVSSDEDMGIREAVLINVQGKMYSYTINLVKMADTAEGGELQCGGVDLLQPVRGQQLEMGRNTIPCYIPTYGDVSDALLPLYVLYLARQAAEPPQSPGSLLYVLYVLYLTRQAAEPPLSPSSLLYVLYVLYIYRAI